MIAIRLIQISTNAFESAVSRFNNYIGYALFDADHFLSTNVFMGDAEEQLAARFSFAPHLFDLVELQYDELSEKEAAAFQGQLNTLLSDECVPWLLLDGKMIKIDARQFEQDLKLKTLENMSMLKSNEPIFQAAFDELVRSLEFFEKSE